MSQIDTVIRVAAGQFVMGLFGFAGFAEVFQTTLFRG